MKLVPQKSHFKAYHQNQMILFPPSLSDFISSEHPVRTISSIIDGVQIDRILEKYSYTGAKAYHPKMMLKLLVYSYLCNVYSSRKIEQAASENVHFMWLSGMQKPDHNTIARFRSSRLKEFKRTCPIHFGQLFLYKILLYCVFSQRILILSVLFKNHHFPFFSLIKT